MGLKGGRKNTDECLSAFPWVFSHDIAVIPEQNAKTRTTDSLFRRFAPNLP